ncbi:MAG TPA: carbamoyltransferase HypF [Actinomycetota bacterium]|nr:carbamoyltransferase HypF [Actinomycetota bacterium]
MGERVRARVRVQGIVQGVGFRPYVYSLATALGLGGQVRNDTFGVLIEVEGEEDAVAEFVARLPRQAPPLALIEALATDPVPPQGETSFAIVESEGGGERQTLISPDVATCDDCLREVFDPADRRFRYPFTNCTNCGPRFTIIRDVPYDRPFTTMAGFAMCEECAREYHDPADRRFHAQPVCCPACGPSLRLVDARGRPLPGDPLARTADLLLEGWVVAVKGLGGYHLAADAGSEPATRALRSRKHREDKPFALMVGDLGQAKRLCDLDDVEEAILQSPRRPIVLLRRRPDAPVAQAVAPGNRSLGLMLPYTPLHHLLARELGRPFVLTSGNVSDEPIAYRDDDAFRRLRDIADAFLTNDRPIHIRTDDSVVRVFRGREMPIRRSRGYVPQPVPLPRPLPRPVLACGAELKNTFCLGKGRYAFLSHHIGDLENYETLRSFTEGIEHFRRLFDVAPEVVAHDLHPEYLSTKWAQDQEGVELLAVQHHHAHVASCLADNGEEGPVIGVGFDGLGYGPDGTMWGGEFLVADLAGFERVGHFEPVPMPGGAAAIREPWRMAAAYLDAAFGDTLPDLDVVRRNEARWEDVLRLSRSGVNTPLTSSVGRLFDAVAAVLGVRDAINYEGQAAIELEQRADPTERGAYPATVEGRPFRVAGRDLVRAVVEDLRAGVEPATVAGRFHRGVVRAVVAGCELVRERTGLRSVALSGGVWQNVLLLEAAVDLLEARGFRVLVHHRVPPNDGGISLGQVAVAGALDAMGRGGGEGAAGVRGVGAGS